MVAFAVDQDLQFDPLPRCVHVACPAGHLVAVGAVEVSDSGVKAAIKTKDGAETTHEFSHVIVAVGIVPNLENIGLEDLKIEPDKRFHIKVDDFGRTNVPGVWAIS